ncbi:MAG: c-type cytochrome [Chloroflexota bacterium]|nr:MAG: hypothetical protein DIU68_08355 [Chloroflexota bacterium]
MRRLEGIAIALVLSVLVGLPVATLGYQYVVRPAQSEHRVIDIIAYAPEAGGFQPTVIRLTAGETVTLRFHAADVVHGVAIGPGLGIDLGHIDPGEVREITYTFDQPGLFTYYCTTWCSKDHWRMRGVIEVVDPASPDSLPLPERDPIIDALAAEGIDIDTYPDGGPTHGGAHPARVRVSTGLTPHVARGETALTGLTVPDILASLEWRRAHTPLEALELLAQENADADRARLADAVAGLWLSHTPGQPAAGTVASYNANCAACHGQTGAGDGPAAGQTAEEPAAFRPDSMLPMRSDVLYAKIQRGGMGTDMPNFGTLFTPEETWALVDYLWWLTFTDDP